MRFKAQELLERQDFFIGDCSYANQLVCLFVLLYFACNQYRVFSGVCCCTACLESYATRGSESILCVCFTSLYHRCDKI